MNRSKCASLVVASCFLLVGLGGCEDASAPAPVNTSDAPQSTLGKSVDMAEKARENIEARNQEAGDVADRLTNPPSAE